MKKLIPLFCGFCLAFALPATAPAQTITNQPKSITVNNASTATFTVGAGSATNYQWQFGGTNLSDTNLDDGGIISGSTNSTLTLEDVSTNEAGTYTVMVDGVASSNAVLTIVPGTIVTFTFSGLLGNAPGSSVQVQLFNHDKPATVENFLHYITAGAYTNMFIDRCLPNFVLQAGDYGAADQTNTNPPITGWLIDRQFTLNGAIKPSFPSGIANESHVGPLIHNRFGTIAMALSNNQPNSANSAFFFNLADNSGSPNDLDAQDFTVFGQILNGTNVLQYFNTLTNGGGLVTNGEIVFAGGLGLMTNQLTNLVNYIGTTAPANSDLVYCTFQLTQPPGATNLPGISITSPTANAVLSNGLPLAIQGTAIDNNNIGLASVRCDLIPLAAADGTLPNGGVSLTNYVLGAKNWSVGFATVPPGMYELGAQAMDEASNLSPEVFVQPVIISAIVTNGNGTVSLTNGAFTDLNAVGYPFQDGSNYDVLATPGTNQVFVSWIDGGQIVGVSPELSFKMPHGLLLTAEFISNGLPNSIAFTYPPANAILNVNTNAFNITGTISNVPSPPVTVTCYVYPTTAYQEAVPPLTNSGVTSNWSVTVSNLSPDTYVVEAVAVDSASNSTAISEDFTVVNDANLQLIIAGHGTVSPVTNGETFPVGTNFQVTATPDPGQVFYTWNNGTQISTNATQTYTMTSGLTLTATFVPTNTAKGISFTYPAANARLSANTFPLRGRIASTFKPAEITCQIFQTNGLAVGPPLTTSGATTWSVTASNIPGGNYVVEAVATNEAGKSTIVSENFSVLAFAAAAGTYSGLFICTNGPVAATNSGFLTFTVGASGIFTGRLLFPAYAPIPIYPLAFENIDFTTGAAQFGFANFHGNPWSGIVYLDLSGGTGSAVGKIFSPTNAWSSQLICYRTVTKLSTNTIPAEGKYILGLEPTNSPMTNGYASLAAGGNGVLSLSGALPDGATFSQSTRVSTNGVWPLYVVPTGYKTNGMLMGWETNQASNNCVGQLYWYNATNGGAYYTNTLMPNVNSTGTKYVSPAVGNYAIVFQEGTNNVLGSNDLTVTRAGGQFTPGITTNKLAISLSVNGAITGHFITNATAKALPFGGAFFGQSQGGSGYILGVGGQTNYFLLEQLAP